MITQDEILLEIQIALDELTHLKDVDGRGDFDPEVQYVKGSLHALNTLLKIAFEKGENK